MGLSVIAYEGLAFALLGSRAEGDDNSGGVFEIHPSSSWPDAALGLPAPCLCSGFRARMGFGLGYGAYLGWRERLAELGGFEFAAEGLREPSRLGGARQADAGPFLDLLRFSHREGALGPRACSRLSAHFASWRGRAALMDSALPAGHDFLSIYDDFARAFEAGSQGGAVVFA